LPARRKTEEQVVRVAPLGELRAYTISEHELENLVQGSPVSDLLTIGLCLLSAALAILITLLSAGLSGTLLTLFFCGLLITGIIGAICTFLGWRGRISAKELAQQIRARMPATPVVQQVAPEPVVSPPAVQVAPPSISPPTAPPQPPVPPSGPAGTSP
jgi:hypothetical protein